MNARKERYTVPISVTSYEEMRREIQQDALRDGTIQGLALAMWVLDMDFGWKGKRLSDFYHAIDDALHLTNVFGKEPDCGGIVDRIREKYALDLDTLEICVEVKSDDRQ